MILSNLTKAIREQNWFAVVLEFLIVIAGVVIGFQITAWNEERLKLATETNTLFRLMEEVQVSISVIEFMANQAENRVDDLAYALDTFYEGSIEDRDQPRIISGLTATDFYNTMPIPRRVHDELIYSGQANSLQSIEIRYDLAAYSQQLDYTIGQFEFAKDQAVSLPLLMPGIWEMQRDSDAQSGYRHAPNLEALLDDDRVVTYLATSLEDQRAFQTLRAFLRMHAIRLCTELANYLDERCEYEANPLLDGIVERS